MTSTLINLYRAYMPTPVREAVMARRRAAIWKHHGVLFIHVPKCAGSSVNEALYGRSMGHIAARTIWRVCDAETRALPSFALLRDPVARAISAYRFVKAGGGTGPGVTAQVRAPERFRIPAFESLDRFAQDWLPAQNLARTSTVFRSQSSFVCDRAGAVLVDRLGQVENMAPTTEWLSELLGRTVTIPRTNVTAQPPNGCGDRLSPESRRVIEEVYAGDVDLLNR